MTNTHRMICSLLFTATFGNVNAFLLWNNPSRTFRPLTAVPDFGVDVESVLKKIGDVDEMVKSKVGEISTPQFDATAMDVLTSKVGDITSKISNFDVTSLDASSLLSQITNSVANLDVTSLDASSLLSQITNSVANLDVASLDASSLLSQITNSVANLPPIITPIVILSTLFQILANPPSDYRSNQDPYELYDPKVAAAFYKSKPLLFARRLCQLLSKSNLLTANILIDRYVLKREEKMRAVRGQEILEFCEKGGATFIKIGQALSVRPDLIPAEYSERLSTLQDKVPPFSSLEAKEIIGKELGNAVLGELKLSSEPVASASIGQVYKGEWEGEEIAVKVQRPNVLSEIALDLYIVRTIAPVYARLTGTATDLVSLVDEWGRGFVYELRYEQEAVNTKRFLNDMHKRGLDKITAPEVVDSLSTKKILTTKWVDGVRLDRANTPDVPELCSTALSAYLTMLLDTGVLHCDPHPGNLLRTPEGKLAILDFGMVLEVDSDLQYKLLNFVSHLTSKKYSSLPDDFVEIGFLKAEALESVVACGILEPLTIFLENASQGGGANAVRERFLDDFRKENPGLSDEELLPKVRQAINEYSKEYKKKEVVVGGLTRRVEELQKFNQDSFVIPDWFLYTSRAFLTLEGICLSADEDYSIINQCWPYVAKRLLSDSDPRAKEALEGLIYSSPEADHLDAETNDINLDQIGDIFDGFSSFSASTKVAEQNGEGTELSEILPKIPKEITDIILDDSSSGNLLQDILLDVSSDSISAAIKEQIRQSAPIFIVDSQKEFLELNKREEKAKKLTDKLIRSQGDESNLDLSKFDFTKMATSENAAQAFNDYAPRAGLLGAKLASRVLEKAAANAKVGGERTKDENLKRVASSVERGLGIVRENLVERVISTASSNISSKK